MKPTGNLRRKLAFCVVTLVAAAPALPDAPGDENWDPNFGVPGVGGTTYPRVRAMAVMGRDLIVGGDFFEIGDLKTTNIARWDGTNWHALGPGLGNADDERGVHSLVVIDSQLYAGGFFTNAANAPIAWLAKWDGHEWGSVGSVNGPVRALASDGRYVYAGGTFTSIGGINASNIAKWDGTNWSPLGLGVHRWRTGIIGGPYDVGQVFALAVRGNELYAGGDFEIAGTARATNVARWNGATWSSLNGDLFLVRSLVADGAGVYAGTDAGIRYWDGSRWTNPGSGVGAPGYVSTLARNGADIYVGGQFSLAGGALAKNVAKWDGTHWSPLGSGLENPGQLGAGASVLAANGSDLFVGGLFTLAGGKPATNIARWRIPHELKIKRAGDKALLSWPATGSNLTLESIASVAATDWATVANPAVVHDGECTVTNELTSPSRFYRLRGR